MAASAADTARVRRGGVDGASAWRGAGGGRVGAGGGARDVEGALWACLMVSAQSECEEERRRAATEQSECGVFVYFVFRFYHRLFKSPPPSHNHPSTTPTYPQCLSSSSQSRPYPTTNSSPT